MMMSGLLGALAFRPNGESKVATTRATLLLRVKDAGDRSAWDEFYRLYAPLLYRYARARGLGRADAEEVRDQCMQIVSQKIGRFDYDKRKGGFKNWLFRIARGRVIDHLRKRREKSADTSDLRRLVDSETAPDEQWERQWRNEHLRYCVARVRHRVSEQHYRAFCMLLYDEARVEDVCKALGMNRNQIYKAKSRVLEQVREVLAEIDPGTRL